MERNYDYRRKLPHRQWEDKVYFITFSTYKRAELSPASRDIVFETCLAGRGRLFDLHAIVVMPDHVHLMLTPCADTNGTISISEITQAIKSTTAHRNQQILRSKRKSLARRVIRSGYARSGECTSEDRVCAWKSRSSWAR